MIVKILQFGRTAKENAIGFFGFLDQYDNYVGCAGIKEIRSEDFSSDEEIVLCFIGKKLSHHNLITMSDYVEPPYPNLQKTDRY